jgi:glutamate-ammonia-ligase adenylyltransferase
MEERVKPGSVNVKYSPGGIIDIEYAAQYLQIQHGHDRPELRTPNTLEALDRLGRKRLLSKKECGRLRDAYLFLRYLIDGLRMVRGNAEDLILPEESSDEFQFLARRLGYHEADWKKGARRLAKDVHRHMENVRGFFSHRFSFPSVESPPLA